jgi:hypothetical protein
MSLLRDAVHSVCRRFSSSYGEIAGLGSRLALSAAVLPDLVALAPRSAGAVVTPSVATAGLRPGAPSLLEAVLSAMRSAGFNVETFVQYPAPGLSKCKSC